MKPKVLLIEEYISPPLLKTELNTNGIENKLAEYIKSIQKAEKETIENDQEHEEHFKNHLNQFFLDVYDYKNNTHQRIDSVIRENGNIRTIIEVKRPKNTKEMIQPDDFNRKAFHEALLYYYEQRQSNAVTVNHILITDCEKFYLISAEYFEKLIQNKSVSQLLEGFKAKANNIIRTTEALYEALAPVLSQIKEEIPAVFVDIQAPELNTEHLYKLFCEHTLFNKPLSNDANALNRRFYNELLYIMGLKEDKNFALVPNGIKNTLLDLTQEVVKNKNPKADIFETSLSLNILWLNRILFLKLLESQLKTVRNDKNLSLLNPEDAADPNALYNLFFNVLNKPRHGRSLDDQETYQYIPYLNSSLFVPASIEDKYDISSINGKRKIKVQGGSILGAKYAHKEMPLLEYLLSFLNCYQFNREDEGSDPNTVIKSSVLGLVFEQLNGYRDGSHFTPAGITMYICEQAIQRQAIKHFNEAFSIDCSDMDELAKYAASNFHKKDAYAKAQGLIDSITIIDPAVGSGHFLVSALNELIHIKSRLGLLHDGISVSVQNDELLISYTNGTPFIYQIQDGAVTKVQEEIQRLIFNTKKHIIENQLFGVDINPNSVNICRLRLWIELLKHSYFTDSRHLDMEALPNLEFKVMTADSLIPLVKHTEMLGLVSNDFDIKKRELTQQFSQYFNAKSGDKDDIQQSISGTLENMKGMSSFGKDDRQGELLKAFNPFDTNICAGFFDAEFMFGRNNFDICIMNPPYFGLTKNHPYQSFMKTGDIYQLFIELGERLIIHKNGSSEGIVSAVVSNKWMRAGYGARTRGWLKSRIVHEVIDLGASWFDSATVDTCIITYGLKGEGKSAADKIPAYTLKAEGLKKDIGQSKAEIGEESFIFTKNMADEAPWLILTEAEDQILSKMKTHPILKNMPVEMYRGLTVGFNDAFILDSALKDIIICQDTLNQRVIAPMFRGGDLKMYYTPPSQSFILNIHNGLPSKNIPRINIDDYPVIKNHLDKFYSKLDARDDQGDTPYNLRNCTYIDCFKKSKILWKRIGSILRFTLDEEGTTPLNSCSMLISNNMKYHLALLNSKLGFWFILKICRTTGTGDAIVCVPEIEQFPIPIPSSETEAQIGGLVDKILQARAAGEPTASFEKEINAIVYGLYGLDGAEIAVVEGRDGVGG